MKPIAAAAGFAAEVLENRRLFAVNLANGTLAVEGTEGADIITVTQRNDTLTVRVGSERNTFDVGEVDEILIDALDGNDRVTLSRVDIPALIDGGGGDDRIAAGRADDVVAGGDGDDRINGGPGDDELFGEADNDRLFGDFGNDDLDGGADRDLLHGGFGLDAAAPGIGDALVSIEDPGDGTILDPDDDLDDLGVLDRFRLTNDLLFAALRERFLLDTTGFDVRPGTSTINPFLSSAPAGNRATFNPHVGVTLEGGGAVVTLPGSGAFARESGQDAFASGLFLLGSAQV